VAVGGGTAVFTGTTISNNTATGGHGGKGLKRTADAADGVGLGGGLYVAPTAAVDVDAFTRKNIKGNQASPGGGNNISGL
jgi:hypothetical protein